MSQNDTITLSSDISIPISRRIAEIIAEKGPSYSTQAIANRMGYSRPTLSKMLNGSRVIHDFELKRIAEELKLPIDRITMEDIQMKYRELSRTLDESRVSIEELEIANTLCDIALGMTEKCIALNNLGRAHFFLHQYDAAHNAWLRARHYAEQILNKYGETEELYMVLQNVVVSYTLRKDFSISAEIVQSVETSFQDSPNKAVSLTYTRAKISESLGKIEEARAAAYKSMEHAHQTGNRNTIGRTQVTVAHYEYKLGNYEISKRFLKEAIINLGEDHAARMVASKELVKSLIKLGEKEKAEEHIHKALSDLKSLSLPDLEGKLYLLLTRLTNEVKYADLVVRSGKYSNSVMSLACKMLTRHYRDINDSQSFMEYHIIAENLIENVISDILDEEDL